MAYINLDMYSRALEMFVGVTVLLPQSPTPECGHRTLWLLHGMSDDDTMWLRRTSIERYADEHRLAVVMPGVQLSCYSDMSHGGKYYTFVAKELPLTLRDMFPLSSRREDNYVAGLSMGGEGAFKIGLANPEQYSVIGCFSAGAFNHPWQEHPNPDGDWLNVLSYTCHDGKQLAGSPEDCFENAKRILSEGKPVPRVYHAIGRDDSLRGAAHITRNFFEGLSGNPFSYTYEEDPGNHTWEFWDVHVKRFLDFVDSGK